MTDSVAPAAGGGQLPPPAYRLSILGGFELHDGARPLDMPTSSRRMVAFLALRDRPVSRGCVAGNLWADKGEARAHGNLRSALWRIPGGRDEVVVSKGADLYLNPAVAVDAREVGQLPWAADAARGHNGTIPVGTLLPDWPDEWLVLDRERLRQRQLRALEKLSDQLAEAGAVSMAIDVAWSAVNIEPLRESAHRCLIRAHLADGNAAEAVLQYKLYGELLAREMGITCSPAMEALVASLTVDRQRCDRNRL